MFLEAYEGGVGAVICHFWNYHDILLLGLHKNICNHGSKQKIFTIFYKRAFKIVLYG